MSKLRIIYILSIVALGVLVVFTVFKPMTSEEKFSEVTRESVIKQEDKWIIEISLINREGKIANYIINWTTGDNTYSERVAIKDGRVFTYIHYVYPDAVIDGEVKLEIYKEGETIPFEETTYYVNFNEERSNG